MELLIFLIIGIIIIGVIRWGFAEYPEAKVLFWIFAAVIASVYLIQEKPEWMKREPVHEAKRVVISFLNEMNPELNKRIVEIQEEIARIDNNIQQLRDLKTEFPNQVLIDKKLSQWQVLGIQLSQVYDDIYQQVETAYVAYRIDEIQGRKKFGVLSEELLKKANAALANAETTKSTIEEQLSE